MPSKFFVKAKEQALNAINKDIAKRVAKYGEASRYDLEDKTKIEAMKDFPNPENFPMEERINLHGLDVKYKAIFLKAQLFQMRPDAIIKVRINRYSGGSSIDAWIDHPLVDAAKAQAIGNMYQEDLGRSDMQSDYFAYDNYVHVMCKEGQIIGTPVVLVGKEMPV